MEDKMIKNTKLHILVLEMSVVAFALWVWRGVGEAILNYLIKQKENGHAGSSCEARVLYMGIAC